MQLTITRLSPDVPFPAYATAGSAAFDLAASAAVEVPPHGIALVPTGLVVRVPPGHFLAIFARSSTPLKRGLMVANGVGVVDSDYCGPDDEVRVQVINVTGNAVQIAAGDRIAQAMVLAAPRLDLPSSAGGRLARRIRQHRLTWTRPGSGAPHARSSRRQVTRKGVDSERATRDPGYLAAAYMGSAG